MDAQTELRQIMTNELSRLKSRNESYSLRAFARKLDLVPSAVSEIMSGKRPISRRFAMKILSQLAVHPAEFPKAATSVKLGASNLLNYYHQDYAQGISVGGIYYVALLYDGIFK